VEHKAKDPLTSHCPHPYNKNSFHELQTREQLMAQEFRIESDSMGELKVPASALWGAQTQRAVENFPISGLTMPRDFIRALGLIKVAAARVNLELGLLDASRAAGIDNAALRVVNGDVDDQFPIDVSQTGSGTSST
jgi:fumarate hydratase class II